MIATVEVPDRFMGGMMRRIFSVFLMFLLGVLSGVSAAWSQWSEDPAANLVIADRTGPQVQAKIVATADGGFYVSWLDNSAGGYDVYLQRLDPDGNEQWVHNGVLVADRGYSSTQDYGLSLDTAGNALLAFRDDRGTFDAVTVAKVSTEGVLLWGADGLQVYSGSDFIGSPKVTGTSDGHAVVAWSLNDNTVVQKIDPSGTFLWGSGITFTPDAGSFWVSDLQAAEAGTSIVSFVHPTGPFGSPIQLWAQKLAAADGASLWGADHVQVFDLAGGSLQFGNFPPFVVDGSGGAVFSWYTSTPSLQCRVQRILANGAEAFAHDGVEVSTNAAQLRVAPSSAFSAANNEVFTFWTEENLNQSSWGLYGQKLDVNGIRQWTDNGVEVLPLGAGQLTNVSTLLIGDEAVVAWVASIANGNDPVFATRIDGGGDFVWTPAIVDLATSATEKSRLGGTLSQQGFAAYVWTDGGSSEGDILGQNLKADGTLGTGLFSDGFESGMTDRWSYTSP